MGLVIGETFIYLKWFQQRKKETDIYNYFVYTIRRANSLADKEFALLISDNMFYVN